MIGSFENGWTIVWLGVVIVLVVCVALVVNRPEYIPPPDPPTVESQALKLEQRKAELAREKLPEYARNFGTNRCRK